MIKNTFSFKHYLSISKWNQNLVKLLAKTKMFSKKKEFILKVSLILFIQFIIRE